MSARTDDPHFRQNLEFSGFSNWHFGHFIFDPGKCWVNTEESGKRECGPAEADMEGLLRELQAPSGAGWDVFEVFLHSGGTLLEISDRYKDLTTLNHNRSWEIGQPMF
jgi:hypothetical protein